MSFVCKADVVILKETFQSVKELRNHDHHYSVSPIQLMINVGLLIFTF